MGDRSTGGGGGCGGGQIQYPQLTSTNYTSWSIMEDQGVWEVMEPSGELSDQGVTMVAAAKAKDKKARAHLL
jgi:hypothetical protein